MKKLTPKHTLWTLEEPAGGETGGWSMKELFMSPFITVSSQATELAWAGSARLMKKALNWKCFGLWFRQNRIILIHQSEFKLSMWDFFYLKITRTLWDLLEISWEGWCERAFRAACMKAVVGKKAETWLYSTEFVTESGVQLLIAQKTIKRQGWWKGKFALFWMPATYCERGQTSVQRLTLSHRQPVGKNFYRQREGATCRNSTVSYDSHLEIGHWWSEIGHRWSDQHNLDCLRYS